MAPAVPRFSAVARRLGSLHEDGLRLCRGCSDQRFGRHDARVGLIAVLGVGGTRHARLLMTERDGLADDRLREEGGGLGVGARPDLVGVVVRRDGRSGGHCRGGDAKVPG